MQDGGASIPIDTLTEEQWIDMRIMRSLRDAPESDKK